jgi:hypothetical protein
VPACCMPASQLCGSDANLVARETGCLELLPTMRLLLIIGPPAVGKMTVGREIAAHSDFRLFHNHQQGRNSAGCQTEQAECGMV